MSFAPKANATWSGLCMKLLIGTPTQQTNILMYASIKEHTGILKSNLMKNTKSKASLVSNTVNPEYLNDHFKLNNLCDLLARW